MECLNTKELCSFFAGDTLNYDMLFKRSDGSPIDITGMVMTFTMKINKDDPDGIRTSIQGRTIFEETENSRNGIGEMFIGSIVTARLLTRRWYHFDFQLMSGQHKYTLGTGKVFVKQKVKTA